MAEPLVRRAGLLEDESGLHALTLSVLMIEALTPEYLAWESATLHQELERVYGAIGPVTWERIQAARALHGREAYWKDWEVFEKITAAIMGEIPIFEFAQPPEAEEVAISLETAKRIEVHEFSKEVQDYITAACLTDGLWYFETPIIEAAGDGIRDYEKLKGLDLPVEAVEESLGRSGAFRDDPQDPVEVQVNRVLEVRLVLNRYVTQVEKQLKSLPELLRR